MAFFPKLDGKRAILVLTRCLFLIVRNESDQGASNQAKEAQRQQRIKARKKQDEIVEEKDE